jgi:hypothetical protein
VPGQSLAQTRWGIVASDLAHRQRVLADNGVIG